MRNLRDAIFYMKEDVLQDFHICISVPLTSLFVLFHGILFKRSSGLIIKCLIAWLICDYGWIKRSKVLLKNNGSQESLNVKYFKEIKSSESLQKSEAYLEPKRASTMELFCEYT